MDSTEHEIWDGTSHMGNGWIWTIWESMNISEDQGSSHSMTFPYIGLDMLSYLGYAELLEFECHTLLDVNVSCTARGRCFGLPFFAFRLRRFLFTHV